MTARADLFPAPLPPGDVDAARARLLELSRRRAGAHSAPEWSDLGERPVPDWFLDGRLGIFVHWLASGVPAFGTEWYARTMYLEQAPEFSHHRATYGPQDRFGYKDFLPRFRGENFDADSWLALFARAGARYVVPVAEHHDGFSLSATQLSRWSATAVGPRRDVISELLDAASRHGLVFGLSSHRAENWWFFNGGTRFPSDVQDPAFADLYGPARPKDTQPDEGFLADWLARTVELVERHAPKAVYFDWWIEEPAFSPWLRSFAAYYYATVPDGIIQYKWDAFPDGAAVQDIERGAVRTIQPRRFQNCTSLSRIGWAYLEDDDIKAAEEVVCDLVDVVSKNGNLLLNVGPRPDGTIDPRQAAVLEDLGAWMAVHGEAVHGTTPWVVYGEGPTSGRQGAFSDTEPARWTGEDLRFTVRGDTLYATFLAPPADDVVRIRSLGTALRLVDADVLGVELLGEGPVPFDRTPDALVVPLRGRRPAAGRMPGTLRVHLDPVPAAPRYEPEMIW